MVINLAAKIVTKCHSQGVLRPLIKANYVPSVVSDSVSCTLLVLKYLLGCRMQNNLIRKAVLMNMHRWYGRIEKGLYKKLSSPLVSKL